MTESTTHHPEATPTGTPGDTSSQAASAADQRIAALRSQLAMVQAERGLLHARSASPSSPPPARSGHGPGGWVFAGLSFVFFLSMVVFAATRPPAVRVVEVEVTREVLVHAEPAPVAVAAVTEEPAEVEPETSGRPPRPRPRVTPTATTATTGMGMRPNINIEGCGGDPLCGS